MDNFEYLNKIAKSTSAPKVTKKPKFFSGSIVKLAIGGVVLFVLLVAIGSLVGNLKGKSTELTKQLYLRTTSLNTIVNTNAKVLKSSQLRAANLSLGTVLTNASNNLEEYLVSKTGEKKKAATTPKEKTVSSEQTLIEELNLTLENARLNGILDRTYSNQIGLQVTLLTALISELLTRTKSDELKEILMTYYNNLAPIQEALNNYTNTTT